MTPVAKVVDVRAALKDAMARLEQASVPSHTLAAELLLMHTLGRDRAWLYAHPEDPVDPAAAGKYLQMVEQRAAGVPTQYLTGHQEFWDFEFEVTPAVLIPRPESEHVVEVALERLGTPRSRNSLRVADIGTGSGCLAIALARELPRAEVFATDISAAALEVARRNAARHGVSDRVHFAQCDLLSAFLSESQIAPHNPAASSSAQPRESSAKGSLPFNVIVSNPPYVGTDEADQLPREVREHEPAEALFAGARGLDVYEPLVRQAGQLLRPGGILVLELGYGALPAVHAMLENAPSWKNVQVKHDLAGIPRVISADRASYVTMNS